jgi:uncharacterized Fe-S cluster-containing radical SAM superfamily protein
MVDLSYGYFTCSVGCNFHCCNYCFNYKKDLEFNSSELLRHEKEKQIIHKNELEVVTLIESVSEDLLNLIKLDKEIY